MKRGYREYKANINNVPVTVEGRPVKLEELSDFEFFAHKSAGNVWCICEKTTGLSMGTYYMPNYTLKDAMYSAKMQISRYKLNNITFKQYVDKAQKIA